jgi:hypothetical protein
MIIVVNPREKTPMRLFRCRGGSFKCGRIKNGRMNTIAVNRCKFWFQFNTCHEDTMKIT